MLSASRILYARVTKGVPDHDGELRVSQEKLPSLPGTAPVGSWRIGTIDRDAADGRLAICAIVARPATSLVDIRGAAGGALIGTGFFVVKNGGFATAKHVALEAQRAMSGAKNSVGLVYTLSNGLSVFRPIWKFAIHPTADLAFGIPQPRQCGDVVLRILVTGKPPARGGGGMPQRIMVISRSAPAFLTTGAG